jgi:hypothetical protein
MAGMLVVRVELWAGGNPSRRQYLGGAAIANVSDLAETSDYVVALLDDEQELTAVRRVRAHDRSSGWKELVSRALRPRTTRRAAPHVALALAHVMAERVRDAPRTGC